MSAPRRSYFSMLLGNAESPVGICTALMLAFMAQADGLLSEEERGMLASAAEKTMPGMDAGRKQAILEELIAIAAGNRIDDLLLACRTLQKFATADDRALILDLLIGMIVSDSRVNLAEHYILEFIADLLGFLPDDLSEAYRQNTGREIPPKGDPSARVWWEVRRQRQQRYEARDSDTSRTTKEPATLGEAYNVLGLHTGATPEEIHSAYRRMAMQHHPDRFQSLGEEAVKRATTTFTHIKKAYDLLRAA